MFLNNERFKEILHIIPRLKGILKGLMLRD